MSVGVNDEGCVPAPLPLEHKNSPSCNIDCYESLDNLIHSIGPQPRSEGRRRTVIDSIEELLVKEFETITVLMTVESISKSPCLIYAMSLAAFGINHSTLDDCGYRPFLDYAGADDQTACRLKLILQCMDQFL